MNAVLSSNLPYCGPAPLPEALWQRWNLDPVLAAALVALAAAYWLGARIEHRQPVGAIGARERLAFFAGWSIACVAWLSPLCSLGVALFSARLGQHLLLAVVAAPLLTLGRPFVAAGALVGGHSRPKLPRPLSSTLTVAAGLSFAALFWLWHAPPLYGATFRSAAFYWLMHGSLLAGALWLWHELRLRETGRFAGVVLCAVTSLQLGLLGGLLTLAPEPLYASHLLTTSVWGLTPLEDQQLGGLLCWVVGCSAFLAAGVAASASFLRAIEPIGREGIPGGL